MDHYLLSENYSRKTQKRSKKTLVVAALLGVAGIAAIIGLSTSNN